MAANDSAIPHDPHVIPARTGYDRWADTYDIDGNPLISLEERVLNAHLNTVNELDVADIGCGTGRHAVRLAQRGARVSALDYSEGMLARAEAKAGASRVKWIRHDLSAALPLEDRSFDLTLCALVMDHVRDVGGLFAQMRRITRTRGRVIMSVMHPAMMLRGVQARFIDERTGNRVMLESSPNQISDYVMGALSAGLTIESISEHAADEELARVCPRAAKHLGWPLLLVMLMRA